MKIILQSADEITHQIWKELERASRDRHHEWRTPVLATADKTGGVNARTVVLRNVEIPSQRLHIYTDTRSLKVAELDNQADAMFVFWSTRLSWQLRARVNVTVLKDGPVIEGLWQQVKHSPSSKDYLSGRPPGTTLIEPNGERVAESEQVNFALINAQVVEIDWLELAKAGHRRAKITNQSFEWLTP